MNQSQRTKNRLREHKDHKWIVLRKSRIKFMNDFEDALLFDCDCGWVGWLPINELEGEGNGIHC